MSIFEEFESDEDLEPGQQEVLNALRQLKVYDIVRFSSATDGLTYPGQVISIESNANGDVSTIDTFFTWVHPQKHHNAPQKI